MRRACRSKNDRGDCKADVIEKILSHLGLWQEDERGPPVAIKHIEYEEVTRETFDDGWSAAEIGDFGMGNLGFG
ncbi:MAG: hypothetical protein A2096_11510 [Spirochaetes bacterium GWF1_41_5]|nr:MAG: hypothetical protein A2096_11510 [Spirochaetes bacterium GWF1_41_5]